MQQQINLVKPCQESNRQLHPTTHGYDCANCQKPVTDYSGMTDAQMLNHIQQHGLGVCGAWRQDQLNRPLNPQGRRKFNLRLFYAALISTLWLRPQQAQAQSVPDTVQTWKKVGDSQWKNTDSIMAEKFKLHTNGDIYFPTQDNSPKRFGTGNVCIIKKRTQIPLTPFYICHGLEHGKRRIELGYWYVPFINKPK